MLSSVYNTRRVICRLLASGSDDLNVILWDPCKHKKLASVRTAHSGNIFSVKVSAE